MATCSVNALAAYAADQQIELDFSNIAAGRREILKRRIEYDFKVAGANISVAAAVVSVVLTLFTGALWAIGLALMSYAIRNSFLYAVQATALSYPGPEVSPEFVQRMANFSTARRDEIARYLEITDPNWQPERLNLFGCVLWLNLAPPLNLQQGE